MSFRNIKIMKSPTAEKLSSFDVLKTRMKRSGDSGMWQDIYRDQMSKGFIVDDWIVWLVGILAGVGAGVGGFFLGKKLCTANSIKQAVNMLVPQKAKAILGM